ncbi:hypothetical protein OOU_Y34scaffold00442g5 [Pyricularia oryzae Y34]|uniref:Uncharacterized protein n=2 Tax=Pyricularia oryzae TaxID=318829 RepID=A0AA97P1V0_PYRO3|nr:hypothetical protein OOU_Y34scaffold00442g5 [Pyricularia oryzae Y34]
MEFLAILAVLALPALTPHGHGDSPAGRAVHCSPNALLRKLFPAALHPGADPNNLDSARGLCQGRQRNRPHRPKSQTRRLHLAALQERGDHRRRRTASSSPTPTYSVLGDGAAAAQPPRRRVVVVLGIPWLGPRVVATTARHLSQPEESATGSRPRIWTATGCRTGNVVAVINLARRTGTRGLCAYRKGWGAHDPGPQPGRRRRATLAPRPGTARSRGKGSFARTGTRREGTPQVSSRPSKGRFRRGTSAAAPTANSSTLTLMPCPASRAAPSTARSPPTPGGKFMQYGVLAGGSAIFNLGAQVEAFVNAVAAARRDFP